MKIWLDGAVLEGAPSEIIDGFRRDNFDTGAFPDTGSFLQHMRDAFVRVTGLPCELPDGSSLDERAAAMLGRLADIGALDILEGA